MGTNQIKPEIWAAYSNMAVHNVVIVVSYVSEKLEHTKKEVNEELFGKDNNDCWKIPIIKDIDGINTDSKYKKAIDLYLKQMPFLEIIVDYYINGDKSEIGIPNSEKRLYKKKEKGKETLEVEKREPTLLECKDIICEVLDLLNNIRNNKSHYIGSDYCVSNKMFYALEYCFDASLRKVIERFWINKLDAYKELEHLKRYDNRGKRKENFFYSLRDKDNKESHFTEKGLAFFLSLFLEKKYSKILLDQISGLKRNDDKKFRATSELFTINRIKIPNQRIDSEFDIESFGLDILNELQKCPNKLFDLLSQENQNMFRVKLEDEAEDDEQVLLKRRDNRFPYFVMRYFDEKEIFNSLRFQIDLGTYYKDVYPKTLKDGHKMENRYLSKHLKGFGRLQDLTQEFIEDLSRNPNYYFPKQEDKKEYRMPTFPHYHFSNEDETQIGIKFTNYTYKDIKENKYLLAQPDAFISIYEFPAMYFSHHLGLKPEEIIKSSYDEIKSFIDKIAQDDNEINSFREENHNKEIEEIRNSFKETFKINLLDIPKDLQVYMSSKPTRAKRDYKEYAELKLRWFVEDTEKRIKWIEDKETRIKERNSKIGKKSYEKINIGDIASDLVEDIVRLQPHSSKLNGKDKMSLPNYDRLQEHFALWDGGIERRKMAIQILNAFGINNINSGNKHPFFYKLNDITGFSSIITLYKAYLKERKEYFNSKLVGNKFDIDAVRSNKEKSKTKDFELYCIELANKLSKQTINLPRGLFFESIIQAPAIKRMHNDIKNYNRINTSFLIQKYFEINYNDKSQNFYNYERHYKFWDEFFGTEIRNSYSDVYMSKEDERISTLKDKVKKDPEKKIRYTKFTDNEKQLRLSQVEDMLSLLMAKDILFPEMKDKVNNKSDKEIQADSTILLQNIGENSSILEQRRDISLILKPKIGNGTERFVKICGNVKIKNYGNFKRFCYDKRMKSFLELYLSTIITKDDKKAYTVSKEALCIDRNYIEKEFDQYDRFRIKVFEKIMQLEEKFFEKNPQEKDELILTNPIYIPFNRIICKIEKKNIDVTNILEIRNAFAHSQYPNINTQSILDEINKTIASKDNKTIAEILYLELEKKADNCINQL